MKMKQPAIYMMANKRNGTIYVGVTSNIFQRISQHKQGKGNNFTAKYGCSMLVYYEIYEDMLSAIAREKQIKAGSRVKKIKLIEATNPTWKDLFAEICC
ncbi:MAG: GIY-YIG nuclease family protein [Alphaproteobacteria bacterium]|nr:GIY-YIG nuclease family protein [Alphaproteobacteria bacterium]